MTLSSCRRRHSRDPCISASWRMSSCADTVTPCPSSLAVTREKMLLCSQVRTCAPGFLLKVGNLQSATRSWREPFDCGKRRGICIDSATSANCRSSYLPNFERRGA